MIVVPSMHIGDSCEPVLFSYEELSDYSLTWRDYPRRRGADDGVVEGMPHEEFPEHQHIDNGDAGPLEVRE